MKSQPSLRPLDLVVGLHLGLGLDARYEAIAAALDISVSQAHRTTARLQQAGLVLPESKRMDRKAMMDFLRHGVRYAFFPVLGPETRGVPTAHSAPPLADRIVSDDTIVWPSAHGRVRGTSLLPLYPGAPGLLERSPSLYEMLTLVDALRVGRAREREMAAKDVRARLESAVL